jgi:hypothetical protein
MNAPNEPVTRPASESGLVRRIAAAMIMSGLVFLLAWLAEFSAFISLLIASGFFVVVVAAGVALELVGMVLEAIAAAVLVVLGVVAVIFTAIFSLFGS